MSPRVKRRFHNIIRRSGIRPERALEVGGLMGDDSLLRFPELAGAERYCLNLVELPSDGEVTAVKGNANDMREFKRDWFDLVVCCSTLTYRVHYKFDYYRFSEQAVREVIFEGMDRVRVRPMMTPPRLIGHGWKPLRRGYRTRAVRGARALRRRIGAQG